MTSEIIYRRGDVVYASLPSLTGSGYERQIAVIVSTDEYNHELDQVITSRTIRGVAEESLDVHILADWQSAGLSEPLGVTSLLASIGKDRIVERYGRVSDRDMAAIDRSLILMLGLEARMDLNPDLLGLDS